MKIRFRKQFELSGDFGRANETYCLFKDVEFDGEPRGGEAMHLEEFQVEIKLGSVRWDVGVGGQAFAVLDLETMQIKNSDFGEIHTTLEPFGWEIEKPRPPAIDASMRKWISDLFFTASERGDDGD